MKVTDYGVGDSDSLLRFNQEGVLSVSPHRINAIGHMPCRTASTTFGYCTSDRMSTFVEMHPYVWSRDDVSMWLDWCRKEYALSDVPLEKFCMNGKALCVLTKEDFKERAPNVGDVLFNTLQQFATTNLHPSFRNGLPQLFPHMATPSGLLMPAATAAAMCNTFIPAAHLQHMLGQTYPVPMTPESSPSAPSVDSGSTPPRAVTPVNQEAKPTIVITQPFEDRATPQPLNNDRIPVGVMDIQPRTLSPSSSKSARNSPRRFSPVDPNNRQVNTMVVQQTPDRSPKHVEKLPTLQKEEQEVITGEDEPLNLSRRPPDSSLTPSPPLLTPHVKAEPPPMPGAGLQAALRAYQTKNHASTTGLTNRQFLTVPGSHPTPLVSSPSVPMVIQKINQCGGEMTVSPDPKFAVNNYSSVQELVKNIKKEPEMEFSKQHQLTPQYRGSPLLAESPLVRQKVGTPVNAPHTPTYDPISPCDDEDTDLETPFSPPVTPGGTLLGFTPRTPGGSIGRPDGTGKLLWEFLSELLNDQTHQNDAKPIVRWIDMNTYTFQILDTQRLSSLWGQQKNRESMNYEKLSRALRYYKKVGIIEKAPGKRLTYRFMKPPSTIKRGQRGARPGVPRKNRRNSLLQSQQSISEDTSSQKGPGDQTPTTVSTPYAVTHMPQFMASGTIKSQLQQVISQRSEAMGALSALPIQHANVAMLSGVPIVLPPSSLQLKVPIGSTNSPLAQPVEMPIKINPKAEEKSHQTVEKTPVTKDSDQSASDSEKESDQIDNEQTMVDVDNNISDGYTKKEDIKEKNTHDFSNKAVHLGMPRPVPTYNPKSKSLLNSSSLSKRRLMSSGDGSAPKKMPRLILPKQSE